MNSAYDASDCLEDERAPSRACPAGQPRRGVSQPGQSQSNLSHVDLCEAHLPRKARRADLREANLGLANLIDARLDSAHVPAPTGTQRGGWSIKDVICHPLFGWSRRNHIQQLVHLNKLSYSTPSIDIYQLSGSRR